MRDLYICSRLCPHWLVVAARTFNSWVDDVHSGTTLWFPDGKGFCLKPKRTSYHLELQQSLKLDGAGWRMGQGRGIHFRRAKK